MALSLGFVSEELPQCGEMGWTRAVAKHSRRPDGSWLGLVGLGHVT